MGFLRALPASLLLACVMLAVPAVSGGASLLAGCSTKVPGLCVETSGGLFGGYSCNVQDLPAGFEENCYENGVRCNECNVYGFSWSAQATGPPGPLHARVCGIHSCTGWTGGIGLGGAVTASMTEFHLQDNSEINCLSATGSASWGGEGSNGVDTVSSTSNPICV